MRINPKGKVQEHMHIHVCGKCDNYIATKDAHGYVWFRCELGADNTTFILASMHQVYAMPACPNMNKLIVVSKLKNI